MFAIFSKKPIIIIIIIMNTKEPEGKVIFRLMLPTKKARISY